jgi:hypothetical protein
MKRIVALPEPVLDLFTEHAQVRRDLIDVLFWGSQEVIPWLVIDSALLVYSGSAELRRSSHYW